VDVFLKRCSAENSKGRNRARGYLVHFHGTRFRVARWIPASRQATAGLFLTLCSITHSPDWSAGMMLDPKDLLNAFSGIGMVDIFSSDHVECEQTMHAGHDDALRIFKSSLLMNQSPP
jgi:hypothetical protein